MRIKIPTNLPTNPAAAYRMGVRDGTKAMGQKGGNYVCAGAMDVIEDALNKCPNCTEEIIREVSNG